MANENKEGETKVQKLKELLEKQLYKKPLNPETPSFSPSQHYTVKLEIDKICNAINSIRSSIDAENIPGVHSLIREISELQTTIAHLRSENSSLKTTNRLLQDEISNNKTLQDELLSIICSNIPMALLVDTPKANAHYDSDKEILEAVDVLHENKR